MIASLIPLLPELFLCAATLLLLVYGVYRAPVAHMRMIGLALLVLVLTQMLSCMLPAAGGKSLAFGGMFVADGFTWFAKALLVVATALSLMLAGPWLVRGGRPFEFIILSLLSLLGMMFMVSANNLLILYMGLEMSSLALYVLASFDRDHAKSSEAGLKYFVLGALASGMLLFGMSLVYGFTGTTGFGALSALFLESPLPPAKGAVIGMVFIAVGLCFKLSAVPFHMWAPDVYEGAPTPVTAFFSTAPKVAALALFIRVFYGPFAGLSGQWQQVVMLVAVLSLLVGALGAIMQTNIKRLLAYSSIGHVGFMLIGMASLNTMGAFAMLVYAALYIFMSAGMFGCVMLMQKGGHAREEIADLAGLAKTRPLMAFAIACFMFSMAGIPPLAGFFGKMYIVMAAINSNLIALATIGVATSVISCYYYLKVVKVMYFDEAAAALDEGAPPMTRAVIVVGVIVNLFFILVPDALVSLAQKAAEALVY